MAKETQHMGDRRAMMLDTPISKLIPKMAIPTIVAMLITSIYGMADTYFVHFLGTSATAAVGVNSSIDQMIMVVGSFLEIGSNSYISRLLGAKQLDKASNTLSTAFFAAIFLGIAVMVPGLIFTDPLVRFLGATDSSAHYAVDYASYVLLAAPFMTASFVLNQSLRSEGNPVYSMVGMGIGGLLNIALDPLFIFTFDMGVAGAAIATAISKLVGFCILIYPYIRRSSVLRISPKLISFARDIVREITLMGIPSLFRMGLGVIASIITINIAGNYSDSAVAAIAVVTRIMMFPTSAILGFGQGFQPVAGFNFGAKRFDRVKSSFKFSSIVAIIFIGALSLLMGLFAGPIIQLFTETDETLLEIGRFCLITQCIVMPLNAWIIVVNMLYSALGKPVGAIILGMSRQGICFFPVVFLLPALFGIYGLAAVQAAADFLSLLVAIPFAVIAIRDVNRLANNELQLPEEGL
ncbi:MAG: MATE family efflux transporter [Oscillospiraceae bacterium]